MFDDLPETYPPKNTKKPRAIFGAAAIHVGLVALIIMIQMALPDHIGEMKILTTLYMASPAPPPPPAPLGPPPAAVRKIAKVERRVESASTEVPVVREIPKPVVEEPVLIQPKTIPADIARIVEGASSSGSSGGVPGGVPGGVVGGRIGGVAGGGIGGVLGSGGISQMPAPQAPRAPVRVGGNVREPKLVKMTKPDYPIAAVRGKVEGVVILEATVTERGTVEQVKVISGPPLLVDAAVRAVETWQYEPTLLDGVPVSVILTARVNFSLANSGK